MPEGPGFAAYERRWSGPLGVTDWTVVIPFTVSRSDVRCALAPSPPRSHGHVAEQT